MSIFYRLYHLARADFFERVRRHGFLVALAFCVYAGYAFLPPNPSSYATLKLGSVRGIYNSAWIGTTVAMLSAVFISMIGFFVVKNAVERDRRTRVGEILATTPISRIQYVLGKTVSNFAVLAAMTAVVALACVATQYIRAEDRAIDFVRLFTPFVLITLPTLWLTAAVAVFFETMPVLRGGVGNIAFFFLWAFLLGSNIEGRSDQVHNDPIGYGIAVPNMIESAAAAVPEFEPDSIDVSIGINIRSEGQWNLRTFEWKGIDWTPRHVGWRLVWVLFGVVVSGAAAIPFDRFDPARAYARHERAKTRWFARRRRASSSHPSEATPESVPSRTDVHLTPLPERARGVRLGAMILAEWKLIVRGLRWWYAGPIACLFAAIFAPIDGVRSIALPLAWFWPVLQWSKLGSRESRHNTEAVFFSAPHPIARQLFATWIAGVMLAALAAGPVAIRFLVSGELASFGAWCVGAMFAPALALALGVWTASGKFFEVLYTALCYAVIQHATPLDFMGAVPEATDRGLPIVYAIISAGLLFLAVLGRRRQIRR